MAMRALERGLGRPEYQLRLRNLSDLAGTWMEDSSFD